MARQRGRHAKPPQVTIHTVGTAERRTVSAKTFQREGAQRRQNRQRAARIASAPRQVAARVTRPAGAAQGALMAELLAGFIIVLIRVVADYEVQSDGTTRGKVLRPKGQYGPLPILTGLLLTFFVLALVASRGGWTARITSIFGFVVILVLGIQSVDEINKVAGTIGNIGKIATPAAAGQESSGAGGTNIPVTGNVNPTGNTTPGKGLHWWGKSGTRQVTSSAKSPGPGWVQFPASTDGYTLAQIEQYVAQHTTQGPIS